MNNVSLLIPKRQYPTWVAGIESVEVDAIGLAEVPLLGTITAGNPIDRVEDHERIKIPANMVRKNTYALKVCGHSMIDDNI